MACVALPTCGLALAEIGLVGRAPGLYSLYLGGAFDGTRLNKLYAQDVDNAKILKLLDPLIVQYANERNGGESFGDFLIRAEFATATPAGNRFHKRCGTRCQRPW